MKIVTVNNAVHGPFDAVERKELVYIVTANGATAELPLTVLGGEGVVTDWNGDPIPEPEPTVPTPAEFEAALYAHFDKAAQNEGVADGRPGWENRHTLYARTAFPEGQWYALALSFATWMDQCEMQALQLLADVQAGNTPPPASIEAFIETLPTWEH